MKPGANVDGCQYTYWIHPHYAGEGLHMVDALLMQLMDGEVSREEVVGC